MTELEVTGDTPADSAPETFVIPVAGKSIVVRSLTPSQMLQMQHEARLMQSDMVDTDRKIKALERSHRGIMSTIVQPSDKEFIEDLMIDGNLNLEDLLAAIMDLAGKAQPAQKPKLRRGRAR